MITHIKSRWRTLFIVVLAIALMVTGASKLYTLIYDPLWFDRFPYPTWFAVFIGLIEISISVWLLVSRMSNLCWIFTTALWSVFFVFATILFLQRNENCGCLGMFSLHPGMIAVIDLLVVALLIWQRPKSLTIKTILIESSDTQIVENFGKLSGGLVAFIFVSFLIGTDQGREIFFGPENEYIVIVNDDITLQPIEVGQSKEVTIRVENKSRNDATVIGGGVSCGCLTLDSMPILLKSQEITEIKLRVSHAQQVGEYSAGYVYYLDHPFQSKVSGRLKGRVKEAIP